MKRSLSLICAVALLAASCTSGKEGEGSRVIVLGIDGGIWTMIQPMMERGELPNLKKLCDSGIHGVLESRPPILSPVVWTTIFTGFGYQKHGVKDWKTSQSSNRRVSAIWEILRERKKKVDVFNVPATWPPDEIPGVMLSGFPLSGSTYGGNTGELVTKETFENGKPPLAYRDSVQGIKDHLDGLEVGAWSPWFPGKVASRPQFRGMMRLMRLSQDSWYLTPLYRVDEGLVVSEPKNLRSEVSKKIGEPYIPEGPGWSRWDTDYTQEALYPHLEQVFEGQSKAALLYAPGDWDLFLYVMTFVDRVSHPYWAFSHPDDYPAMDPEKVKKYADRVEKAYRASDEQIGRILKQVKGDPYVVIVSDHGFQSATDTSKAIGTHNPDGIYVVSGPGIKPKTGTPHFIEDVTPTLLYLLGMPVGADMDGHVFPEVAEAVGRNPVTIASYETTARPSTDQPVDKSTWESLRGLGYVDGAAPRKKAAGAAKDPQSPGDKDDEMPGSKPGAARKPPEPAPGNPQAAPAMPEESPHDILDDWPEDPNHPHEGGAGKPAAK